ncbi:MAG: VCBS repeat-containing protein [Myxococcota bacterium]|nr:VCBS repeat-containing protein [Myxococcota bacterium]
MTALLLLLACSNRFNDRGGDPNLADDTGSGDTQPVDDTGNPDDTGDPADECPAPPSAGSVSTLSDCSYEPEPSGLPFSATVEWAMTHAIVDPASGSTVPAYTFTESESHRGVFQSPAVGQATDDDGDGVVSESDTPDIAVLMGDELDETSADAKRSTLRLISGDGSKVHDSTLWSTWNGEQVAPYIFAGVAMADLDGDGLTEIATVVMDEEGRVNGNDANCMAATYEVSKSGKISLEAVSDEKIWCQSHAPALADLDADGNVEVILGDGVYDGRDMSLLWTGGYGAAWYNAWMVGVEGYWNSGYHAFAYDMDGDGLELEVVAGNSVYNADGSLYCRLGRGSGSSFVEAEDGYPAVADLMSKDGVPEIILSGNQSVSLYKGAPDSNGVCQAVSTISNDPFTESLGLPTHPYSCDETRRSFGGQPTIADFDGDGKPEVGVSGACYYTVYDVSGGQLERYAMAPTKDWSSASTGGTVFDFNGDEQAEVVFSDEYAVYVWQIDASAGLDPWERFVTVLEDENHHSWTIHEYPLVADVDADGKAEIVAVNSPSPDDEDAYGIYVLGAADDDWVSARPHWNQHAYYVNNIDQDGTVGTASPNYAPYDSDDLNSFRQQAPGEFGAKAAPNLYLETSTCQAACGEPVVLDVQIANEGAYITVSGGALLSLYGRSGGVDILIDTYTVPVDIGPGELTSGIRFEVADWASYDKLVAVIDDPDRAGSSGWGAAKECDEKDNSAVVGLGSFCE